MEDLDYKEFDELEEIEAINSIEKEISSNVDIKMEDIMYRFNKVFKPILKGSNSHVVSFDNIAIVMYAFYDLVEHMSKKGFIKDKDEYFKSLFKVVQCDE